MVFPLGLINCEKGHQAWGVLGVPFSGRICRRIYGMEQLGKPAIELRSKPGCERAVKLLSGVEITVDIYGRLIPGGNQKA